MYIASNVMIMILMKLYYKIYYKLYLPQANILHRIYYKYITWLILHRYNGYSKYFCS